MSNKASAVAGQINHVKVVVLALLASIAIMLVGFSARATDDTNGYGLVRMTSTSAAAHGGAGIER